jgi:hypothetical protein
MLVEAFAVFQLLADDVEADTSRPPRRTSVLATNARPQLTFLHTPSSATPPTSPAGGPGNIETYLVSQLINTLKQ